MMAQLFLLAVLLPAGGADAAEPVVALHFDTLEATSIRHLDEGKVTFSRQVRVPAGDEFIYEYTDPRDDHTYRLTVRLTPLADQTVGAKMTWRDQTAGRVVRESDDLAVDGEMTVALHPLAHGDGELFLRLAPTVVAAD